MIAFEYGKKGTGFVALALDHNIQVMGNDLNQLRANANEACKIHFGKPMNVGFKQVGSKWII